jgi:peptide/nickel transport system permease protein
MKAMAVLDRSTPRRVGRVPLLWLASAACIIAIALLASYLGLPDPNQGNLQDQFLPPIGIEGSQPAHPLGTDGQGRDILSRLVFGARTSLLVVLGCIALGGGIGSLLGLVAGYLGNLWDKLIMRMVDAVIAFPVLLLALVWATILGPGYAGVIVVLSITVSARYARLVRSQVLVCREKEYVLAALLVGCGHFRIIRSHILPNVLGPIVIFATMQVGWTILMESALSFLGAGVPLTSPAWGSMVSDGRDSLEIAWWVSVIPGAIIAWVVVTFNMLGDWLRDYLDPKARQIAR